MAADSEKVEVICPDIQNLLEVETNLTCPVEKCTKILSNTSALRMHVAKTHKIPSNLQENDVFEASVSCPSKAKIVYCCPVDGCVRGRKTGRHFHRLANVKQHYMHVHGEKKFTCKKCAKKFGRNDVCLRHEKICGKTFACSCGVEFTSRTSMLTHAKRNGHVVLGSNNQKLISTTTNQAIYISFVPVVGKGMSTAVRPLLPRKVVSDVETQTELPCNLPNESLLSKLTNEDSLSTHSANESSLTTNDKGVTVNMELEPDIDVICKHTQTVEAGYLQSGFATDEHFDVDFTIDNEDFKELAHSQTQTNWDLAFDNFPIFEDNETQTLDSYLGLDPSSITTDCATQTKNILDEIFSVDTETQTLVPTINFDEEFDGIPCGRSMDGQTQTLPNLIGAETSTTDILQGSTSNVETQTSFNDSASFSVKTF